MTGLRTWRRDAQLPARAGQPELCPPHEAQLLELVLAHALRPGCAAPQAARWVYARWKPGVSLCAAYELEFLDGRSELVVLKRYRTGKAASLALRGARAEPCDPDTQEQGCPLLPSVLLPDQSLHLWHEHSDRKLPGLQRLSDMRRTKRLLQSRGVFSPWRLRSHRCELTRLRYRPERRAVQRLDAVLVDATGARRRARLAVRALVPSTATRVAGHRRALGQLELLPQLRVCEARTGLLFEDWIDDLTPVPRARLNAVAAESLMRLHRRPCQPGVEQTARSSNAALFDWHAGLASRVQSAWCALPSATAPARWLHGDFHADQLALRPGGQPVLLDLDGLRPGDPAEDLASWIADELCERDSVLCEGSSVLDAYRDVGGVVPPAATLDALVRRALVDRAAACLRRLEHGAEDRAERLLGLAAARVVGAQGA
ncbi:MAG: hypothetical protein DRQ55_00660 [Planctomycetota bacterium]|nr:MAG: hypothetical protein DRQ55_00660 [Planctomycetota bacterium]